MNKKLIVKQNGYKDCGPSCLLSIMKYYGLEASHEEVSYILKTGLDGTNAYNIINGSRSFGFDGYGVHYSFKNIVNKEISFPIICHVLKNGMFHFIVVYDVKKDNVIIMDPASDITKIKKDEFKNIYLNTSLVLRPIKRFEKLNNQKTLLDFILEYIIEEKKTALKLIILSVISLLLGILGNYYTLICIDLILPNYKYSYLIVISIFFAISFLVKNIMDFYRNRYIINIEKNISIRINSDVINKYFNLPYQFFKSKSIGESISRLNDLNIFKDILSEVVMTVSLNIILIIISLIILLTINLKLFAICLVELILYYFIVLIFKKTFNKKNENMLIAQSEYSKILNDSISGYEINKNLNMINDIIKKNEIKYISFCGKEEKYKKVLNFQSLFKDIINSLFSIFSICISFILINENIISLGEFILFNSIVYYFKEPLKSIMDLEPNINYIRNIYNRINDLIIMKNKKTDIIENDIKEDIIIKKLSYSYDGINNIFENVNISIKYGSKFLIYADSGSGKSTLIKILLKYFEKYNGEIYIGNINLKDIAPSNISFNMTYVSQKSYVESDTLKNNIVYGRDISDEEYEKVLEICNLKDLRDSKLLRNEFMIEDNGFNISGGERQKIILARSILKNSNYLILDEALSEIDFDEEIEILNKIFDIFKDKTIICISHKSEMIEKFDLKYKLERSKVYVSSK